MKALFFLLYLLFSSTTYSHGWDDFVDFLQFLSSTYGDMNRELRDYKETEEYRQLLRDYQSRQQEQEIRDRVIAMILEHQKEVFSGDIASPCGDCQEMTELSRNVAQITRELSEQGANSALQAEINHLEAMILLQEHIVDSSPPCDKKLYLDEDLYLQENEMQLAFSLEGPIHDLKTLQAQTEQQRIQFYFVLKEGGPLILRITEDRESGIAKLDFFRVIGIRGLSIISQYEHRHHRSFVLSEETEPAISSNSDQAFRLTTERELFSFSIDDYHSDFLGLFFNGPLAEELYSEDLSGDASASVTFQEVKGSLHLSGDNLQNQTDLTVQEFRFLNFDNETNFALNEEQRADLMVEFGVDLYEQNSPFYGGAYIIHRNVPDQVTVSLGGEYGKNDHINASFAIEKAFDLVTLQAGAGIDSYNPEFWIQGRILLPGK